MIVEVYATALPSGTGVGQRVGELQRPAESAVAADAVTHPNLTPGGSFHSVELSCSDLLCHPDEASNASGGRISDSIAPALPVPVFRKNREAIICCGGLAEAQAQNGHSNAKPRTTFAPQHYD